MFLTNHDLVELTEWRRRLHRMPELSGEEAGTAREVEALLASAGADRIVTGLGGHGVAGIFEGPEPGPTVMVRAELDGLPIEELSEAPHRSVVPGKAHLCGHDGHMAILATLARHMAAASSKLVWVVVLLDPEADEDAVADVEVPSAVVPSALFLVTLSTNRFWGITLVAAYTVSSSAFSIGGRNTRSKLTLAGRLGGELGPELVNGLLRRLLLLLGPRRRRRRGRRSHPDGHDPPGAAAAKGRRRDGCRAADDGDRPWGR